jgi:hypothetical protein
MLKIIKKFHQLLKRKIPRVIRKKKIKRRKNCRIPRMSRLKRINRRKDLREFNRNLWINWE